MVADKTEDRSEGGLETPGTRFSVSLKDLFIYVAHFAVCSWFLSKGLWPLVPIYAACVIGYQLGKNTEYVPIIVGICASAFTLAFLFGIFSSFLTFFHPMSAALGRSVTLEKILVLIVWLVALLLFLLLRKMLRSRRKPDRGST